MVIVICILCSISVWIFAVKKSESFIKILFLNFLLTVFCYSYYIGYSITDYKAAFCRISPNAIYFGLMSGLVAIIMGVVMFYQKQRKIQPVGVVDYHLESIDRKWFCVILLLAFVVRIIGIDWGNGATYHPDEGNVVRSPIYMAENNTFMSDETFYPAQTTGKILCIIYKVWMLIGSISGVEISDLSYVLIARAYIVLLSTSIVACVFLIGNLLKKHAGTVAATLVAVFPPFVQAAHCVTGDTVVAFLLCLSILCAFYYLEDNREFRWVFMMTMLAVLATLEKYHGMFLFALVALVVCMKQIRNSSYVKIVSQGFFSIAVVLVSIIVIVPNLCMNIEEVFYSLFYVVDGFEGESSFLQNAYAYSVWFISYAGVICLIPLIIGVIYFFKQRAVKSGVLGIGLIYIIAMCSQNRHVIRWGYPFYMVLLLLIGVGIVYINEIIKERQKVYYKIMFYVGLILIVGNGIVGAIFIDVLYNNSQYDTRVPSMEWCLEHGIVQEECIYDNRTCWNPGGMVSPHKWIPGMSLGESLEQRDDELAVNHLGKRYAIAWLSREDSGILDEYGIEKKAFFEADYKFIDSSFSEYENISKKIFELYNIFFCLGKSIDILSGKIYIGSNIAIYDISKLDSYENFGFEYFEREESLDGIIYTNVINSIFAGNYTVEVFGCEDSEAQLLITTDTGDYLTECKVMDGSGQFSMQEDCYGLKLNLILDGDFENVRITMQ